MDSSGTRGPPNHKGGKVLEAKKRTEEATADLRELQYGTEIANTIIKVAQLVGNLAIGRKTGKVIREYTEKKMSQTPPINSSTVTQHYDPEMNFKGVDKTVTTKWDRLKISISLSRFLVEQLPIV